MKLKNSFWRFFRKRQLYSHCNHLYIKENVSIFFSIIILTPKLLKARESIHLVILSPCQGRSRRRNRLSIPHLLSK